MKGNIHLIFIQYNVFLIETRIRKKKEILRMKTSEKKHLLNVQLNIFFKARTSIISTYKIYI
jgi:hypothetical protein